MIITYVTFGTVSDIQNRENRKLLKNYLQITFYNIKLC